MDARSIEHLSEFLNMSADAFDLVRIVNPANKQVRYVSTVDESGIKLEVKEMGCNEKCYKVWGIDKYCENCSSARAEISNRITVKEEMKDGEIYQIVSVPFKTDHEYLVMELVSIIPHKQEYLNDPSKMSELKNVIQHNNLRAIMDFEYHVYNHNYAIEQLNTIISISKGNNKPFIIVCFEIEVFNDYNYEVSHQQMAKIKEQLVNYFKAVPFGGESWTARIGTERFLMYFDHDDEEQILNLLTQVKKEMPKTIRDGDMKFSSGTYIGITRFDGDEAMNYDFVIKRAVDTLLKAKKKVFKKIHISGR